MSSALIARIDELASYHVGNVVARDGELAADIVVALLGGKAIQKSERYTQAAHWVIERPSTAYRSGLSQEACPAVLDSVQDALVLFYQALPGWEFTLSNKDGRAVFDLWPKGGKAGGPGSFVGAIVNPDLLPMAICKGVLVARMAAAETDV